MSYVNQSIIGDIKAINEFKFKKKKIFFFFLIKYLL